MKKSRSHIYKTIFASMVFLFMVGCTAGTSSTRPDTGLQPKKKINCATIEPYTAEERQFCAGGDK
jgi:hypothetical protein